MSLPAYTHFDMDNFYLTPLL